MDMFDGTGLDVTVDREFEKKYNNYKRNEERRKLQEMIKNETNSTSIRKLEEHLKSLQTDSESEDDYGEKLTSKMDLDIAKTLLMIKKKDPRVYDDSVTFYRDEYSSEYTSSWSEESSEDSESDSLDEKVVQSAPAPVEGRNAQQDLLDSLNELAADGAGELEDFFSVKEKTEKDIQEEDERYREWRKAQEMKEKVRKIRNSEFEEYWDLVNSEKAELKKTKVFNAGPFGDRTEYTKIIVPKDDTEFLKAYLTQELWKPRNEDYINEDELDRSEDESTSEGQDGAAESSFRIDKKKEKRKEKRRKQRERKKKEKLKKQEQIKRAINLKKQDLEERKKQIAKILGDVDSEEILKRIEESNILDQDFAEDEWNSKVEKLLDSYDPPAVREEEKESVEKKIVELTKEIAEKEKEIEEMQFEDIVADIPTRFKYRQVKKHDFGLSAWEVLHLPEKELNRRASLKYYAPYREDQDKISERLRRRRMRARKKKKRR